MVTVSFSLFYFVLVKLFSQHFFQLNYYLTAVPATLPKSIKESMACCCHTCLRLACRRQWRWVFPFSLLPPTNPILSHSFFYPIILLFSWLYQLSSLNPIAAIHMHGFSWEGNRDFLSFLFPPFQTFSHSFFFQSNCYPIHSASCSPSVNQENKVPP